MVRVAGDPSLGTCLGPKHNGINFVCGWLMTTCV